MITKIISGGQSGVDRAALDLALKLGIPHGGWCPKGRLAEDGVIPSQYHLSETATADYTERTAWNVRDSDGTLILSWGEPSGGTAYTLHVARESKKPIIAFDLLAGPDQSLQFQRWAAAHAIAVLNVAGPRESTAPGEIYRSAYETLCRLLIESAKGSTV